MENDEFTITKLMQQKKDWLVEIVETNTKTLMYCGPIRAVAKLTNLTEYQVIGYAQWGYPSKALRKAGYFFRWKYPEPTE